MIEVWREIPGEPGYEASNHGRIRSVDRELSSQPCRGASYTRAYRGVVLAPADDGHGYQQVQLGRGVHRKVHILVTRTFHGPRPAGMEACHNDGNSQNNRADNLQWGTSSANKLDAVRHGTHHQARKTQCPRGHDLLPVNLVPWGVRVGKRSCLACSRARGYVRDHAGAEMQAESDRYYDEINRTTSIDTPGPGGLHHRRGRRR